MEVRTPIEGLGSAQASPFLTLRGQEFLDTPRLPSTWAELVLSPGRLALALSVFSDLKQATAKFWLPA